MTAVQFRQLALNLRGVIEAAHVGHPDFRVGGRIFATLAYPDDNYGVLILNRDVQQEAIGRYPEVFEPVRGAWGRQGNTQVRLSQITSAQLKPWMKLAWQNAADKPPRRSRAR